MRNFIYAIGVCSLLFSCNSELETLPEEFNTEGTAPLVTRVAAHPKYGVLGWGYDVTGNYMSHGKGVTLPVIDIDRFEAENFDRIVRGVFETCGRQCGHRSRCEKGFIQFDNNR